MADAPGDRSDGSRSVWPGPARGRSASPDPLRRKGEADAWNAFSHLLAGMLLWGGLGWLASRLLHAPALIGVGLVVGTAGGLALVWLRYGRSDVISGGSADGTSRAAPAQARATGRTGRTTDRTTGRTP